MHGQFSPSFVYVGQGLEVRVRVRVRVRVNLGFRILTQCAPEWSFSFPDPAVHLGHASPKKEEGVRSSLLPVLHGFVLKTSKSAMEVSKQVMKGCFSLALRKKKQNVMFKRGYFLE
jgi:hypothetical protein